MPNLEDWKPDTIFRGLFISRSGDGKSSAGASFPEPYHELDPDLRFGGIAGSVKQGIIKNRKISYQQFKANGGWEPVGKHLEQLNLYRIQAGNNVMPFPYKTIGLGSLGSLERILMNMARKELEGRMVVGGLRLGSPGDQRIANSGIHQVLDYLQDMPCNLICTAHIIEKWGKPKYATEKETKEKAYLPNEIIGDKLNLNDNLAESVVSRFDNVFQFSRQTLNGKMNYFVEFSNELAKNAYGIPVGEFNITGKDFYTFFLKLIGLTANGEYKFDKLKVEMEKA